MADLGKAYVQIVASAEGISGSITEALAPEAKSAGKQTGTSIMQNVGGAMGKAGKALTLGVTAPIAAIGGASMAAFGEMRSGLDTIIKKTGATGDTLEGFHGIMDNVVSNLPIGFETAGAAIGEVNTRFGSTGEELQGLSEQFIKFAELNGTDVSQSIDSVQQAMATYGLEAKDAGAFLDTLNKAGQDTGVNVNQLAQSMTANGTAMKQMGFSAADSAGFLANLEKSGIESSTVMTGMRKAMANATKDGKSMGEAMSELQDSIVNASDDTEAYQMAIELFGTKAGPAIADAVREGRLSFEALGTSLEDNVGNIDNTFEATLTPMDEFKTAMNSLKTAGAEVGTILLTNLKPVVEKVVEIIKGWTAAWKGLSPETQGMIIKIAAVAAVIGPVIGIVSKVISVISMVKTAAAALGPIIAALTSPIGIVVAAVAAAVAAGILLYKNWDTVKEKCSAAWNAVKEKTIAVWNSVKSAVKNAADAVRKAVVEKWSSIKEKTSAAWNAVKTAVSNAIQKVKSVVTTVIGAINTAVTTAWNTVKEKTASAWNAVKTAVSTAIKLAKTTVTNVVNGIKSGITGAWDSVKTKTTTAWNAAKNAVKTALNGAKSIANTVSTGIKNTVSNAWTNVKEKSAQAWENVKTKISTTISGAKDVASKAANSIKTGVSTAWNNVKSKTSTVWSSIKSAISTHAGGALSTVQSKFNSIKEKISGVMDTAKDAVGNAIQKIKDKFNFSWSLPKLSLPHISIKGKFSLNPPSVPSFGIDWYKTGAVFERPSVIGVGEAGPEAVVPLSGQQMRPFAKAIASEMGGRGTVVNNYITVSGAENPEDYAVRLARKIKLELRTNG